MGLVEGATEFLPVSSTFHLIWTGKLLGIEQTEFLKTFEVFIQSGGIAAVLFLYIRTLLSDRRLTGLVLTSFIPTATVGLILYRMIRGYFFENELLQLGVLLLVGIFFILYERFADHTKNTADLTRLSVKGAILIGLAQALAVVPGVSRAGAVIIAMMMLRFRRDEAAKYSFLLAVPTIFAASALDLIQMREVVFSQIGNAYLLGIGFVTAFISALVIVKWFIRFLGQHSLEAFGWYRIALFIVLVGLMVK